MPESIANVLGSAGFAEAARAFQYNNIGGAVPEAIRATLMMFDENEQQLQAAIDRASRDIVADAGNMNADSSVIAALALIGQSTTVSSVESARRKALDMIDAARDRLNNISDPDTPEARLQRAWAAFDRADRDLDEAFRQLPLTEQQRREYERLEEQERIARERYEQNPTAENMRAWQSATASTSAYVDQTVQTGVASGQFTPQEVTPVIGANDRRDNARDLVGETFSITNAENVGFGQASANSVENTPSNHYAHVNDSMADINIAPAGTATVVQNEPTTAAATVPVTAEQSRFETADIALGDTGQFSPASAGQPVVTSGTRTV